MSPEETNLAAYNDVLAVKEPRTPNDPAYMERYRAWQEIAGQTEPDEIEEWRINWLH